MVLFPLPPDLNLIGKPLLILDEDEGKERERTTSIGQVESFHVSASASGASGASVGNPVWGRSNPIRADLDLDLVECIKVCMCPHLPVGVTRFTALGGREVGPGR